MKENKQKTFFHFKFFVFVLGSGCKRDVKRNVNMSKTLTDARRHFAFRVTRVEKEKVNKHFGSLMIINTLRFRVFLKMFDA